MSGHRPSPDFFGREHTLDQIDTTFFPNDKTVAGLNKHESKGVRSIVICGLGEIGKTERAIRNLDYLN